MLEGAGTVTLMIWCGSALAGCTMSVREHLPGSPCVRSASNLDVCSSAHLWLEVKVFLSLCGGGDVGLVRVSLAGEERYVSCEH